MKEIIEMVKIVGKVGYGHRPFNLFLTHPNGKVQAITVSKDGFEGQELYESEKEIVDLGNYLEGRPVYSYELTTKVLVERYPETGETKVTDFKTDKNC